jgi:predicted transcriptional regulator
MHDERLTVRIDLDTLMQLQSLAERTEQTVSQVVRDALTLLLGQEAEYHRRCLQHLSAGRTPLTPEQLVRIERLIAE